MDTSIGIKLADGTFFPILNEDALSERNLELTTIRDHQESVQINLFKKNGSSEPEYIGSLIVEEITDGLSGDPTISLKIKLDADKNLSAEAVDEGSGARQSLKVSLKTLNEESFNIPDFSLAAMDEASGIGEDPNREDVYIPEAETDYSGSGLTEADQSGTKKKTAVWLVVLLILLCIGALVAAIMLLTKKMPLAEKTDMAQPVISEMVTKEDAERKMNEGTEKPPVQDPAERAMKEMALAEKEAQEKAALEQAEKEAQEKQIQAEEERKKAEEQAEAARKAEMEAKEREAKEAAAKKQEAEKKKQKKSVPTVGADGVVRYKVKWGDTLWDLSETFYKNPWLYTKIAKHNKIKNPSLIISDTYIEIPPK